MYMGWNRCNWVVIEGPITATLGDNAKRGRGYVKSKIGQTKACSEHRKEQNMEIIKSYSRKYKSDWTGEVETFCLFLAKIGDMYVVGDIDTFEDPEYGENGRSFIYDTLEEAEERYDGRIKGFEEYNEIL